MRTLIILALVAIAIAHPFTSFNQCDSSATYAVTITNADSSVYPILPGVDTTITLSGSANDVYQVTHIDITLVEFGIKQTLAVSDITTKGSATITTKFTGKQIPSLLPAGTYNFKTEAYGYHVSDSSKSIISLNCYNLEGRVGKSAVIAPKPLKRSINIKQCKASAKYSLTIDSADASVYPIQPGVDNTITVSGSADDVYQLTHATVSLYGIKKTVAYSELTTKGSRTSVVKVPGSQIPSLFPSGTYSFKTLAYGYRASDSSKEVLNLNCYYIKVQIA